MALPLASDRWSALEAAYGSASDIPELLHRFREKPDADTFDSLRRRLIGDGDIVARTAFYAALPHVVESIRGAVQPTKQLVLGTLGWAAALAADKEPPADLKPDYQRALVQMRDLASAALLSCDDQTLRRYLLAAIAAGFGDVTAASTLIHLHDALLCHRCGALVSCASCGLPLEVAVPFHPK